MGQHAQASQHVSMPAFVACQLMAAVMDGSTSAATNPIKFSPGWSSQAEAPLRIIKWIQPASIHLPQPTNCRLMAAYDRLLPARTDVDKGTDGPDDCFVCAKRIMADS
jgi:hypothetical protein